MINTGIAVKVTLPTENWSVGCNLNLEINAIFKKTSISQTKDISTNTHSIVMGH